MVTSIKMCLWFNQLVFSMKTAHNLFANFTSLSTVSNRLLVHRSTTKYFFFFNWVLSAKNQILVFYLLGEIPQLYYVLIFVDAITDMEIANCSSFIHLIRMIHWLCYTWTCLAKISFTRNWFPFSKTLLYDNHSAMYLIADPNFHARMKCTNIDIIL